MTNILNYLPIDPDTLDAEFADMTPRQATALLHPYDEARAAVKQGEEARALLGEALKTYLLARPDEVVTDLEHGLEARLQTRSTGDTYAIGTMPTELLSALAGLGALKVDAKVIDALKNSNSTAARALAYRRPGGTTISLQVKGIR